MFSSKLRNISALSVRLKHTKVSRKTLKKFQPSSKFDFNEKLVEENEKSFTKVEIDEDYEDYLPPGFDRNSLPHYQRVLGKNLPKKMDTANGTRTG